MDCAADLRRFSISSIFALDKSGNCVYRRSMDEKISQICYSHRQRFLTEKISGDQYRIIANVERENHGFKATVFLLDMEFIVQEVKGEYFLKFEKCRNWIQSIFDLFEEQPLWEIFMDEKGMEYEKVVDYMTIWTKGLFDGEGGNIKLTA